jgi:GntR family transcriptional regulator
VPSQNSADAGCAATDAPDRRWHVRLERESPVPLHFQLRSVLLRMIEEGSLGGGVSLPPERELAVRFGVSLAPVRQAVLALVREGTLYRVRGKGTFLRERSLLEYDAILSSFTGNLREKGADVEMRVVREATESATPNIAAALGARRVYSVDRLALVDGEPAALLTSILSTRRFPRLSERLRAYASLYLTLHEHYGVIPVRADTTVELAPAAVKQCELLGIPPGSSVLVASGTTYDQDDRPTEHFRAVYRGDRIRLRLDTYRYRENVVVEARQPVPSSSRKVQR